MTTLQRLRHDAIAWISGWVNPYTGQGDPARDRATRVDPMGTLFVISSFANAAGTRRFSDDEMMMVRRPRHSSRAGGQGRSLMTNAALPPALV